MNEYEQLLSEVIDEVPVLEVNRLVDQGYNGLYRNGVIYLDSNLKSTIKKEKLAEEYGHYKTTVGNIVDYTIPANRKQEIQARRFALEMLVPIEKLIECNDHGLSSVFECAEYLGIEEEAFRNAILHYHTKYGSLLEYKDKTIILGTHFINIIENKIAKQCW